MSLCCSSRAYYSWIPSGTVWVVPLGVVEVKIRFVGWNVPLARAEFSFTASSNYRDEVRIERVKVNGTTVDFYPEDLSLKDNESAIVKVYFAYRYSTKYEFGFIDSDGNEFGFASRSPSERENNLPNNTLDYT